MASVGMYTPKTINKVVSTAGTRVALASSETPARVFTITALSGNTGVIYIGDITVSSTVYGIALAKGNSLSFGGSDNNANFDLSRIYIDVGTNNDAVSVLYF